MEFPDLGKHCSESFCRQMDFLPVKCDACQKVFCKDHFTYSQHQCPSAYRKDVQVPVCPLCNAPVPIKRGDMPDVAVSAHIDNDCKSDPAVKKRKIYTNRCNKKGCKVKELIKVNCNSCALNFCLTHRHPQDHECGVLLPMVQQAGLALLQCRGYRHPRPGVLLSLVEALLPPVQSAGGAEMLLILVTQSCRVIWLKTRPWPGLCKRLCLSPSQWLRRRWTGRSLRHWLLQMKPTSQLQELRGLQTTVQWHDHCGMPVIMVYFLSKDN